MRTLVIAALLTASSLSQAYGQDSKDSTSLDSLRHQPAISKSFNLATLPPDAGENIFVAVIGQGLDPALAARVGSRLTAVSAINDDPDPFFRSNAQASTSSRVASVVAALAPRSRIVVIKALNDRGQGPFSNVAAAVAKANALKPNIILIPMGAPGGNDSVAKSIADSLAQGSLVVAPAGNDGKNDCVFPANLDGVTAVGAIDERGERTQFSNFGSCVPLMAPGLGIVSAGLGGRDDPWSGTSMSVAVAGGIFAMLWSQNPKMKPQQLADIVVQTALPVTGAAPSRRIDGKAALDAIRAKKK